MLDTLLANYIDRLALEERPILLAKEIAMPVYMVYVCHSVSDRAQLEKYWASIAPTLEDW